MSQDEEREQHPSTQTINLNEVYDHMNVQTGYEHHSKFWNDQVKIAEAQLDKKFEEEDKAQELSKNKNESQILAQGMTPADDYVHHMNPSVDFDHMYDGVTLL